MTPSPRCGARSRTPFARLAAARIGSAHRELHIPPGGFWSAVEAFTATEEEPYHSPNLFTSQQVRRRMRADGIRMYLVGAALLKPPIDIVRGAPGLADLLRQDMLRTRMPYWLRSGDKAHMAVPIESRSPFLDYRVVELAFTLPLSMLVREGWHKWVVRKAVEDLLPPEVVWRRRKQGFPFPYARFFAESQERIADIRRSVVNPWVGSSLPAGNGERRWRHVSWLLWYADQFAGDRALFARLVSPSS